MRRKIDLTRYAPPGLDLRQEKNVFITGMLLSFFYSLVFILDYFSLWKRLWEDWDMGGGSVLKRGAKMEPFLSLLDNHLLGYILVALCALAAVGIHYAYFHQGSKSIYLMRRLPDRRALGRMCWTLPLAAAGLCLVCFLVSLLLFYGVYVTYTPPECLPGTLW